MRSVTLYITAAVVVTPLLVLGCPRQQPSAGTGVPAPPVAKAPAPPPEEEEAVNPTPTTKAELTIGIAMTWGHPYWQNMITGFKEEAARQEKKLGKRIALAFNNAEEDASKQISQCQNLVAKGVDAVIMVPVQEEASVRGVWLLNDANIPVILVNRQIKDTTGRAKWVCYTGTDTYQGAKVSAELLMKALGGKGNIVELQQVLGSNPQVQRTKALADVLKENPDVKLISQQPFGADEAKAVSIMQDLLKAHPEINGVYPHGDNAAMFALKACEDAGRKDIKIVGMGGNKDAMQAIRDGRMVGTSYQQPYEEGVNGIKCAIAYLMGEKVKRNQPLPTIPITKENVGQHKAQF